MKILLAGNTEEQRQQLSALFPKISFVTLQTEKDADGADAVVGFTRSAFDQLFTPAKIAARRSIRWYHAPGAGIEEYLFDGIAEQSFILTNGKIIQGPEVAEHAIALLLALTRRLNRVVRGVPYGEIPRPIELMGKSLLVVGAGGIGLLVAERAAAFGMRVQVVTEDNVPLVSFIEKRWLADQLLEALPSADMVVVAAPLTPASRKMMNTSTFAVMKAGSYFVIVSRGGLVDTDALTAAIESGHIEAAGLDVTDSEPLPPDHILFQKPNVLITPHLAGISDNLRGRNFELILTNLRRFEAGLPLINTVNKSLGY